ncbi:MAG TPA: Crp/Fnr family transcriptional regulator [Ktedonobacteraceae bacterium]|nr:Crp/Fnr family transcriptional regulator [Ktedonobacteraceae bacterium]
MLFGSGFTFTPLGKLCLGARVKHYPKNQILLYGGDTIPHIYLLKKGVVKLYDIDHQGNEKVLHILKPPSMLPLTVLGQEREDTAWFYSAITDCDVYSVAHDEFEKRVVSDSKLAACLLRQNAEVMNELLVRLSSLGKNDARGKLAYVLRFLAVCHARERHGGWRRVLFPVGHQLLADMIGMTRESTAISMKRLRERQIVRYPRATQLEIHLTHLITNEPLAA